MLTEKDVPSATLKARAMALRELGCIFKAARAPPSGSSPEAADGEAGPSGRHEAGPSAAEGGTPGSTAAAGAGAPANRQQGVAAGRAGSGGAQSEADKAKEARRQMEEAMMKVGVPLMTAVLGCTACMRAFSSHALSGVSCMLAGS